MVTVMSQGNSEGTRRCDASCYNAKGRVCRCICGGRNHGAGYGAAIEHNREMFPEVQRTLEGLEEKEGIVATFPGLEAEDES